MGDTLLKIYHSLPAPLRTISASMRGLYISYWRYGKDTERLVEEGLERDNWSSNQWKGWQEERLAAVLHRAATKVPYYRDHWSERRRKGDRRSYEYLENWPVLKKQTLRENPGAFVAEDCDTRRMFLDHTSGTTGTPLKYWSSRHTLHVYYALCDARLRRWSGLSRKNRWSTLGGQQVVPPNRAKPPFWVFNAAMNQLYLSANHISQSNIGYYIEALNRYNITHMIAYSSSATVMAQEAIQAGLTKTPLEVVLTNAEPVYPWQRNLIGHGLGAKVRATYGMTETVAAATECEVGTLHCWPEVGWLEVFKDSEDSPIEEASSDGRYVCTSLLNLDMPLVRYEVGDRGRNLDRSYECSCGRKLPRIEAIEGRTNDLLYAPDGRRVYWLNPVFYGLPIVEAQIIQELRDHLHVLYVPAPGFNVANKIAIQQRLIARMGDVRVTLEEVLKVPRAANGKFQAIVSRLDKEKL
jgi:phenylacetate-CoA ligase